MCVYDIFMARVNKPKNRGVHQFLIQQEQKNLGNGKDRKVLRPVTEAPVKDVNMGAVEKRETRREKSARKELKTKKRKAPVDVAKRQRMDLDDNAKLRVKKSGGIHK